MQRFVPPSQPCDPKKVALMASYLKNFRPFLVVTGAGVSTESDIPDYRSEGVGLYATSKNRPVQYNEFVAKAEVRQRYWARNYVAWPRFSSFLPNLSHSIIRKWQNMGLVSGLITQNVDSLHHKAGSLDITELHGSTSRVRCISCDFQTNRHDFQKYILSVNPQWSASADAIAPDGDVHISIDAISKFNTPVCPKCSGIVKPDVVFFGENVPKPTVDISFRKVEESSSLLIAGSSLETYSAFRLIRAASDRKKPVLVVNIGKTRADKICNVKVEGKCSFVFGEIDRVLSLRN